VTESESYRKIAGEPVLGDTAEGRSQIEALIREDTDFLPRHGPFTESALGRSVAPRQSLSHIVEQDHRAVKRITRSIQGFKDFRCAGIILGGVELMHM
jgi:transposase-like protein